jgi:membrane protease YdiL (CAAX protease family)
MLEETAILESIETKPMRPFPGIWASIGWIVLFFALQLVAAFIAIGVALGVRYSLADLKKVNPDDVMSGVGGLPIIWSLVLSSLMTIGLLWLYLRKDNRVAAIQLDQWSQISVTKTLIIAAALIGAALAFNYLYTSYVIPDIKMQDDLRKLFESIPKTTLNTITLFVTVAVLAPLTEELLFRGLLQKSLSHRMPHLAAIGIAGLVFAAIHLDLYAFPALFVMGASFGYIYYRTGSLRVNIVLHMVNNGAALLLT